MTDAALQQDIGALKAEVRHLNATIDRMAETMDEMKEKMDRVEGGRAMLWGLLAAAGTVGGIVVGVGGFILQHIWPR